MTIQELRRSVQKMVPIVALALAASVALPAAAQDASGPILFTNVNVFDGVNEALIENANVVVTDNLITAVSTEPLAIAGGTVIDGGGRTMMPGMIDVHWHTYLANMTVGQLLNTSDMSDIAIAGLLGNEQVLMRGFTTVRDIGETRLPFTKPSMPENFPVPACWCPDRRWGKPGATLICIPIMTCRVRHRPRCPTWSVTEWSPLGTVFRK